jgi:hypothetical protein
MVLGFAYQKPFKVHFPNKHEWQNRFNSLIRKAWSGIQMGPKPMKKMVLECINGAQTRGIDSVLDSTPQFSRQKYISSRNAYWRTWKRAAKGGISIFSLIAKQPLRHIIIPR